MATIIKQAPGQNGAYANQSWPDGCLAPDGYAVIPESFAPVWEQYKPFVTVVIEDDVITEMTDNPQVRAAQEAADAEAAANIPPSPAEQMRADVNFIAAMMGVEL